MDAIGALRRFFEQQLAPPNGAVQRLGIDEEIPSRHLIGYLVEQTVRRAALDAAAHRSLLDDPPERAAADVSWKHCLMVAALTELRSLRLAGDRRA